MIIKNKKMWEKILESAFLKYEKTEKQDDSQYLKNIDSFSNQEVNNSTKDDWKLDIYDTLNFKKEFSILKKSFSKELKKSWKDEEIEEKLKTSFQKIDSFGSDFLVLWKIISDLKKDLIGNNTEKEKITKNLTDFEKLNKWWVNALKEDYEHNKVFDEALNNDLWKFLEWWIWKDKIKELFKIPWLWWILKWFLWLDEKFQFSNKSDKFSKNIDIDDKIKNWLNDLDKISPEKNWIKKLIENIWKIKNWEWKKIINTTFNNLAKYHKWIKNFYSNDAKFSKDNKNIKFEIEANSVSENIFLRKEINWKDWSWIWNKTDVMKNITDTLKWKWDFNKKFEKIINKLKNEFSTEELKKITDSNWNIKIATIDPNNPTKLNITFINGKDLLKKSKEK